ncbi:TetR/AcrR family transcriptional regulator [Agromyces seonyuensis]|uniref:TetR family transcriptional regulator n=1 Tax=Agromyces seonyuensis TaxID=2662446 RepID=A0A6I4NW84_9MICO|nr:TetR/AcrR family transcriptional regulator [Agromyces seonyuensis]MWB98543.1 TetR family transcriptional regulator [Agromyces seonyuensis]
MDLASRSDETPPASPDAGSGTGSGTPERPARRRGPELEAALLDAAWAELSESGYDGFTFERVAERAGTSRPVLYRRWPDKPALVKAALARGFWRDAVEVPDTGTLRGDVLEGLRRANAARAPIIPLMSVLVGSYYLDTGTTFAELRAEFVRDRRPMMETFVARALERGELTAPPPARVVALPFDLYRQHLLLNFAPLAESDILGIVDELFLPLVGLADLPTA